MLKFFGPYVSFKAVKDRSRVEFESRIQSANCGEYNILCRQNYIGCIAQYYTIFYEMLKIGQAQMVLKVKCSNFEIKTMLFYVIHSCRYTVLYFLRTCR